MKSIETIVSEYETELLEHLRRAESNAQAGFRREAKQLADAVAQLRVDREQAQGAINALNKERAQLIGECEDLRQDIARYKAEATIAAVDLAKVREAQSEFGKLKERVKEMEGLL